MPQSLSEMVEPDVVAHVNDTVPMDDFSRDPLIDSGDRKIDECHFGVVRATTGTTGGSLEYNSLSHFCNIMGLANFDLFYGSNLFKFTGSRKTQFDKIRLICV